jgi:hypothetical protein
VEQIDRPKLAEDVVREALMQDRDRTIQCIAPVALAVMIDEYAIFGPKLGDPLSSFLGVSLPEHLVEIAFDEGLYHIPGNSHSCAETISGMGLNPAPTSRRCGARTRQKS